jgi:hypothetical protein
MLSDVQSDAEDKPQLPRTAQKLPELPPELLRTIVRATLAACDSSLSAWLLLRTVSRDGRRLWKVLAAACAWCLHGVCK